MQDVQTKPNGPVAAAFIAAGIGSLVLGITIVPVASPNVIGMILRTAIFLIALMRVLDRHPWPLTPQMGAAR